MAREPNQTGGRERQNGVRQGTGEVARGGLTHQGKAGMEHRGESLVAMDNPDDSQLGAEPRRPAGRDQ